MTSDLGPKSWGEIFSNLKIEVKTVVNRRYEISNIKACSHFVTNQKPFCIAFLTNAPLDMTTIVKIYECI